MNASIEAAIAPPAPGTASVSALEAAAPLVSTPATPIPPDVVARATIAKHMRAYTELDASDSSDATTASNVDGELDQRFGPQLAVLRAALPTALRGQFSAQLAALASGSAGGDPAADEGAPLRENDATMLAHFARSDIDDASLRSWVGRLARYVSQHGPSSVVRGLPFATPPATVAIGFAPQTASVDKKHERSDDRPQRHRKDVRPDDGCDRDDASPATAPAGPGYTLDDIVCFSGETIAVNRQEYRSLPWPF